MLTRIDVIGTYLPRQIYSTQGTMSHSEPASIPLQSPEYDPVRNVGRMLVDAAAQMTRSVDRRARQMGISGAQWVVLTRIGDGLGNTASELCRTIGYDSGAMTRMLDRLEKSGLIAREPSPGDGRVATISLTPAASALRPSLRPIADVVLDEHLRGFSPEEVEQFIGFLERVLANGDASSPTNHDTKVKEDG